MKNKVKSGDFFKKKPKNEKIEYNDSRKQERPARDFIQFPGETDREFVHRVNKICTHVVKEAEFEERYGVEIKRNENGEVCLIYNIRYELDVFKFDPQSCNYS